MKKKTLQNQWNQSEITQPKICSKHQFLFYSFKQTLGHGLKTSNVYIGQCLCYRIQFWSILFFFFLLIFGDASMPELLLLTEQRMHIFRAYFEHIFRRPLRCLTVVKLFALVSKRWEENCNVLKKGLKFSAFVAKKECAFETGEGEPTYTWVRSVEFENCCSS